MLLLRGGPLSRLRLSFARVSVAGVREGSRVDAVLKMADIGRRMVDLEKRISGDWFELKEKAGDFHALLDVIRPRPRG